MDVTCVFYLIIRTVNKIESWEKRFIPKLQVKHKHFAKKVFHRLMKKSATLKSSLKRRSKEYEVECNISLDEIRGLFLTVYGKKCRYCDNTLDVSNLVCDHIYPVSMGGNSDGNNLQIICARCNTRKGSLTHREYKKLLFWLRKQSDNLQSYVLRKLAKGDIFK